MAIPLTQKFHTKSGDNKTREARSTKLNDNVDVFTMQELVDTVIAEGGGGTDYTSEIAALQSFDTAIQATVSGLPSHSLMQVNILADHNATTRAALSIENTNAADRIYVAMQMLIPQDMELVGYALRTEFAAGISDIEFYNTKDRSDNTNIVALATTGSEFLEAVQEDCAITTVYTGALSSALTAGDALSVTWQSAVAPGKIRLALTFKVPQV